MISYLTRRTCPRPLRAAGLRNAHPHRVSLAAVNRGAQRPGPRLASLSKKAEELMQAAVSEAAQKSAATSQKALAELRHIHSSVDRVTSDVSVLRDAARVQQLQMARLVLGPSLEYIDRYGPYTRFTYPHLMDHILELMLRGTEQPIQLDMDRSKCLFFDAVKLQCQLDGLTGLTSKVFQVEGSWFVQFED